jgi:hypothetical protein
MVWEVYPEGLYEILTRLHKDYGFAALYITEAGNHDIRKIASGMVTHVAGSTAGWHDDDDPALAQFYGIEGLDITGDGTRLVIADGNNGDGMAFNHIRVLHR